MNKGNIKVSVENIFPLIKKFLYSDNEIFLRELISNASDATLKLKYLITSGKINMEYSNPKIEVVINKDNNTLHIIDEGIGMTEEEVNKYINDLAFSGAEEFINKHKDVNGLIGHFGLGFYSSFMVSDKVEIITKSFKDEPGVHWICDGSPNFTIQKSDKKNHGTEIILHISDDCKEYLENNKINELLYKYNKFMPIPIKFGMKKEKIKDENNEDKEIEVDNIINNTEPAWIKNPTKLTKDDYNKFYKELYPSQFEDPLFQIHLNVDYPFNLTGILFFPKIGNNINIEKDKIQLYQNQVFVTDEVKGIVPDFLMLLRGVIDSPDIPLNVSRSYLQADNAVKKISSHITKKVSNKMELLIKEDRKDFEKKWNDIKIFIEYGMITEDSFFDKSDKFMLYETIENEYLLWEELINKIKDNQKNKDNKIVILYTYDLEKQYSYVQDAKNKGYTVILFNSPLYTHLMQKIESSKQDVIFACVDSDHISNIINTNEIKDNLSEEEKNKIKDVVSKTINNKNYNIQLSNIGEDTPLIITKSEFIRRMEDMQKISGNSYMNNMPEMYNLLVNTNSKLCSMILDQNKDEEKISKIINQAFNLARLSQNILKGEELNKFIKENFENIMK